MRFCRVVCGVLATVVALAVVGAPPTGAQPVAHGADPAVVAPPAGEQAAARSGPEATALAEAKRTGRRVEVPSERSATKQVFALPGGGFEAELSSEPTHVLKGGSWQPIDPTLVRRTDGAVVPRAAADLVFSGGGSRLPLVRYSTKSGSFELRWPGKVPEPRLQGSTATYGEILPGVDLRLTATDAGFTKVFVVKTREAASRLTAVSFGLRTDGLTMTTTAAGLVSVKDKAGLEILTGSKPLMWDSPEAGAISPLGAKQTTGRTQLSKQQLTIIPDRGLLTDPAAKYPLFVDPTYEPPQHGWTKAFSGHPTNNYWNGGVDDGYGKAGYCGFTGCQNIGNTRSWWQYDISALRGAIIKSAEFNLHQFNAGACGQPVQIWASGIISGQTTWNFQPGTIGPMLNEPSPPCGQIGIGTGVGSTIDSWLKSGRTLATFLVRPRNDGNSAQWKRFDWAKLVVAYNWAPGAPTGVSANVANGPSLGCPTTADTSFSYSPRPTLRATINDRDNESVKAEFVFQNADGSGAQTVATPFQAANKPGYSITVPAGKFANRSKIAWRVRGVDQSNAGGPWSAWCTLTVDSEVPAAPGVTSTDFPEGQTAGYVGKTGAFEVTSTDPDVIGYHWEVNFDAQSEIVDVNSPHFVRAVNGRATILATAPRVGSNDLYVRAVDRAMNTSDNYAKVDPVDGKEHAYHFLVGSLVPPPAGHWPLDGAHLTTTAPDISANARHGAITGIASVGASSAWTFGRIGDALKFTGTTGHVTAAGGPPVDTSKTFSVTAWAKLDKIGGHPTVVSIDSGQTPGFQLQATPAGQWAFAMFSGDVAGGGSRHDRIVSPTAAKLGVWTHVAGTYDTASDQLTLYVDGVQVATGIHPNAWRATGALTIGRSEWNNTPSDFWPGAIDDVRVYDRLLTADEVVGLAGSPTLEEAFYPLEEGAETTAADVAGEYRNGTLIGDATWTSGYESAGAVQLDGAGDAVAVPGQAVRTDGSFTVEARAKLDVAGSTAFQTVVSQDGPSSSGFALQYLPASGGRPGGWAMSLSPADAANPAWVVARSAEAAGTDWVHLAGVYDASKRQLRLYVDGVLKATQEVTKTVAVNGNLVLGRAKQAGVAVAYFDGALDDVHLFTGVRSDVQVRADNLSVATSRPNVHAGQLARYVSHNSKHYLSTGPVPRGARFEGSLGLPVPAGTPNTQMVYSCEYPGGQFTSISPTCENMTRIGTIGLLYKEKPDDVPTLPIYRCLVPKSGDHFNSHDENCEGFTKEWLHGYSLAYRNLISYELSYGSRDRLTTSGAPAIGYQPVGVQGIVAMTNEPGTRGLVSCVDGTDEFLSNDAACEGKTVRHWVGNSWDEPPAHARASATLFSCSTIATGERFTSLDEFCDGENVIRPLGYVITRL